MTSMRLTARPGSYLPYLLLFLPLACAAWAFWPTLTELYHTWSSDPQYSHGFLVPVFAAFLLWMRRGMLKDAELRPTWWGLPLVLAGIGLHLCGAYFYWISLDAVALVPVVAGLWLTAGGWAGWRWGWPAVVFLLFMIPLPYRYAVLLSGPLQNLATVCSTFIMQVIGLPALSEGNIIQVGDARIGVVEACSGLRMLVVFFALAAAVGIVSRRPLLDKLIVLVSAVPIAIFSNIVRVTVTGILHHTTTSDVANAFFHDLAGWFMMPLALGLLWVELKFLSNLFIDRPAPPPGRGARGAPTRRTAPPARAARRRTVTPGAIQPAPQSDEAVTAANNGTEN
jgi:exosortase